MIPTRFVILPAFTGVAPGFYSFIGPVAYYTLRQHDYGCRYYCDGMFSALVFSLAVGRRVARTSFDYGSIAGPFLEECARRGLRLLVMGGQPAEAEAFSAHLMDRYPTLKQRCIDGFPAGGFNDTMIDAIHEQLAEFEVLLLALGSPLQERVGQSLMARGFAGTIITAGAFITQTSLANGQGAYYPTWINSLNLRFLWRLIHEPHTRSRFKYVFSFPISYAIDRLRGSVQILRSPT